MVDTATDQKAQAVMAELTARNLKLPNQKQFQSRLTPADIDGLTALGNSPACQDWLYRLAMKLLDERAELLKENHDMRNKNTEMVVEMLKMTMRDLSNSSALGRIPVQVGF